MSDEPLQRQVEQLETMVRRLASQLSRLTGPYPGLFLAKDGDDDGQWQEQTVYDGEIVEFDQGRRSDAADHPSNLIVPPADVYFAQEIQDVDTDSGKLVTRFVKVVGSAGLVPVDVVTDGGDGDATAFTYTFTLKGGGDPLGTLAAPEWVYEPNIKVVAATNGTAYQDVDGVWTLYQVDEVPDDSVCP